MHHAKFVNAILLTLLCRNLLHSVLSQQSGAAFTFIHPCNPKQRSVSLSFTVSLSRTLTFKMFNKVIQGPYCPCWFKYSSALTSASWSQAPNRMAWLQPSECSQRQESQQDSMILCTNLHTSIYQYSIIIVCALVQFCARVCVYFCALFAPCSTREHMLRNIDPRNQMNPNDLYFSFIYLYFAYLTFHWVKTSI